MPAPHPKLVGEDDSSYHGWGVSRAQSVRMLVGGLDCFRVVHVQLNTANDRVSMRLTRTLDRL